MTPEPTVTAVVARTNGLCRSAQRTVGRSRLSRMSAPPIVGVPAFTWCVDGPSERTIWPICLRLSSRMNHGASTNESSMAVMVAMIVRNGMYRRTLSHESHE
jgi:hypothetical protein